MDVKRFLYNDLLWQNLMNRDKFQRLVEEGRSPLIIPVSTLITMNGDFLFVCSAAILNCSFRVKFYQIIFHLHYHPP